MTAFADVSAAVVAAGTADVVVGTVGEMVGVAVVAAAVSHHAFAS